MSDSYRIERLENSIRRLCNIIYQIGGPSLSTELNLIKQYVNGDLEPKSEREVVIPVSSLQEIG